MSVCETCLRREATEEDEARIDSTRAQGIDATREWSEDTGNDLCWKQWGGWCEPPKWWAAVTPLEVYELRQKVAAAEEQQFTLLAEQGRPEGAPHPDWKPGGGMILHWSREYPDGSSGRTRQLAMEVEWSRLILGLLSDIPEEARPPKILARGTAPNFRAAMIATDKAVNI